MKILALFSRVSRAFPGESQLMDLKVCRDQLVLSMSFLANVWAASCLAELLIESACDSFAVDSQDGFGGSMNAERNDFRGFCIAGEVVHGKGVGMYIHLSCPW